MHMQISLACAVLLLAAGCEKHQVEPAAQSKNTGLNKLVDKAPKNLKTVPCQYSDFDPPSAAKPADREGLEGIALGELNPATPRNSVDHVITYASRRGGGPKGGVREITYRRGPLIREETQYIGSKRDRGTARKAIYYNLDTRAAVYTNYGSDGRIERATFSNVWSGSPRTVQQTLTRTDEQKLIAGERCTVWTSRRQIESSHLALSQSACVTDDGLVLSDTTYYNDSEVMSERHAVRVERRDVHRSVVLPPNQLLDWSYWDHSANPSQVALPRQSANYALTLGRSYPEETRKGTDPVAQTYRADGIGLSQAACSEEALETLLITTPRAGMAYLRGRSLSISRDTGKLPLKTPNVSLPTETPSGVVLGEQCSWFVDSRRAMDSSRSECKAHDGLPLFIVSHSWGDGEIWQATELTRGGVAAGSVSPPTNILNWSYWGWPEI